MKADERPTGTAVSIALSLLSLRARGEHELVDAHDAGMLAGALRGLGGGVRLLAALAQRRGAAPLARFIEWCLVPGIMRHFGVRKKLIGAEVARAVTEGASRVVVLGAGLDLLTARMARRGPGAALIEVDRAETTRFKQRMLDRAGVSGVTLLAADLAADDLGTILEGHEAASGATIFVAEGLTMYLEEQQVADLLERLARIPGASRLVFTFLEPGSDGRAAFPRQGWLLTRFLRASREKFRWGFRRDDVGVFVAKHGWRLARVLGAREFGPGFTGEFIAVCERD